MDGLCGGPLINRAPWCRYRELHVTFICRCSCANFSMRRAVARAAMALRSAGAASRLDCAEEAKEEMAVLLVEPPGATSSDWRRMSRSAA